ncbi:hypothetical protein EVAR_76524_1 [Eumeta japonica]|uniref:Uncharacterized protein n=1 Tax=Eumeta variegata TaxID=151549 RepID=A0A4C1T4P7_EUMVA|nr:hypothetical protein EVAR_76524_1 [Eumeta japonica]
MNDNVAKRTAVAAVYAWPRTAHRESPPAKLMPSRNLMLKRTPMSRYWHMTDSTAFPLPLDEIGTFSGRGTEIKSGEQKRELSRDRSENRM